MFRTFYWICAGLALLLLLLDGAAEKKLAGAAKNSFTKKCVKDTAG